MGKNDEYNKGYSFGYRNGREDERLMPTPEGALYRVADINIYTVYRYDERALQYKRVAATAADDAVQALRSIFTSYGKHLVVCGGHAQRFEVTPGHTKIDPLPG